MAGQGSWARRGAAALFSNVAWQAFWTWGFTPLVAIATVAVGFLEHFPVMWIIMAGCLSFGGMSIGVLAFSRWLFVQSAKDKVILDRIMVSRDVPPNKPSIVLGIAFKNTAHFPVETQLIKMTSTCASRIPGNDAALPRFLNVDANSGFYFNGGLIDLTGVTADPMNATLHVELLYGRPGGKQHKLAYAHKIAVPMDPAKPFTASAIFKENEQIGSAT